MTPRHLLLVAALGLAACGGSTPDPDPTPTPDPISQPDSGTPVPVKVLPTVSAFSADPSGLPTGGGKVTLHWSVSDATQVSIDHGVGDVTGMSMVEVDVTQSTTFTLTASNADGTTTASASITVADPITVTGQVLDARGQPEASATVVLGTAEPTVTDTEGRFSVSGVASPYTATVVSPDQHGVTVYQGLTAGQLTLTLLATRPNTNWATVSGHVYGGTTPYDATNQPVAGFVSPESGVTLAGVNITYSSFSFQPQWATSGSTTGKLFALQPTWDQNDHVTGYTAFGSQDGVTLNANASASGLNVTMNPVSSATLTGEVAVPAQYAVDKSRAVLEFDSKGEISLLETTGGGAAFGFNVPLIPASHYAVVSTGHPTNRANVANSLAIQAGLTPGNTGVSLTLPPVASLGIPVDGANAVDQSSQFAWTSNMSQALFDLRVVRNDGASILQIDVVTTDSTAQLPDLSRLGVVLPSGVKFLWQVLSFGPFQDVNEAATSSTLSDLVNWRISGGYAISDARTFTTH
jgi:hypothetical protein